MKPCYIWQLHLSMITLQQYVNSRGGFVTSRENFFHEFSDVAVTDALLTHCPCLYAKNKHSLQLILEGTDKFFFTLWICDSWNMLRTLRANEWEHQILLFTPTCLIRPHLGYKIPNNRRALYRWGGLFLESNPYCNVSKKCTAASSAHVARKESWEKKKAFMYLNFFRINSMQILFHTSNFWIMFP